MELALQLDLSGLDLALGRITEALRPDAPGPFQNACVNALDYLMQWEQERYEQFSEGGGDWPDLAPSTKLKRAYKQGYRRGRHPRGEETALEQVASWQFPILIDTGTLFESLTSASGFHEYVFEADGVSSVTNVPYGVYHQLGGSIPGRPPQRQFIVEPPEWMLAPAGQLIAAGIEESFGAAAL